MEDDNKDNEVQVTTSVEEVTTPPATMTEDEQREFEALVAAEEGKEFVETEVDSADDEDTEEEEEEEQEEVVAAQAPSPPARAQTPARSATQKEARPDSKRGICIAVMRENEGRPASEVYPLIVAAQTTPFTLADAKAYYNWVVKNGLAPGDAVGRAPRQANTERSTATERSRGPAPVTLARVSTKEVPEEVEKKRVAARENLLRIQARQKAITGGTVSPPAS